MDICLVFNFHVEKPINPFSFFDVGKKQPYFDLSLVEKEFVENGSKKHLSLLDAILKISSKKDHKFSIFFSGLFLELMVKYYPEYIREIKKLVSLGKIELLGGTYNNSLSCLFSIEIFKIEVEKHLKLIKILFGCKPTCFSNTENIYSNELGKMIKALHFKSAIAPAIDWYLERNDRHQIYQSNGEKKLPLLLTDYQTNQLLINSNASSILKDNSLSDKLYVVQINPTSVNPNTNWIDLLSGIKTRKNKLVSTSEALKDHKPSATYNIPNVLAVNASGQDLSYFVENPMQKETIEKLKFIKGQLHIKSDKKLLEDLMDLSSADHLIRMNTKVHSNEITGPYDQYLSMMNILADLEIRISKNKRP
ncbi:hypothetical protein [Reichenbachiella sp. MALMAid0571]|uniref:hypothetical protein n=1 Tax=Reichenbachiella sp. MALMAid0571 TaxID=3143939 RepID=UPI0032E04A75